MKPRTSHYPIGQLLLRVVEHSGLSLHYFSLAIGYGNSNKGVRAFDQMLRWGVPNDVFISRLQSSRYAIPCEVLTIAIAESQIIVDEENRLARIARIEEERKAFVPFIQAIPEYTTPTSITFHALTGGLARYTHYLPTDLPGWNQAQQERYLRHLIPAAFAAAQGKTLFMGAITGYKVCLTCGDPGFQFSVTGTPLKPHTNPPLGEATLTLSGRPTEKGDLTGIITATDTPDER